MANRGHDIYMNSYYDSGNLHNAYDSNDITCNAPWNKAQSSKHVSRRSPSEVTSPMYAQPLPIGSPLHPSSPSTADEEVGIESSPMSSPFSAHMHSSHQIPSPESMSITAARRATLFPVQDSPLSQQHKQTMLSPDITPPRRPQASLSLHDSPSIAQDGDGSLMHSYHLAQSLGDYYQPSPSDSPSQHHGLQLPLSSSASVSLAEPFSLSRSDHFKTPKTSNSQPLPPFAYIDLTTQPSHSQQPHEIKSEESQALQPADSADHSRKRRRLPALERLDQVRALSLEDPAAVGPTQQRQHEQEEIVEPSQSQEEEEASQQKQQQRQYYDFEASIISLPDDFNTMPTASQVRRHLLRSMVNHVEPSQPQSNVDNDPIWIDEDSLPEPAPQQPQLQSIPSISSASVSSMTQASGSNAVTASQFRQRYNSKQAPIIIDASQSLPSIPVSASSAPPSLSSNFLQTLDAENSNSSFASSSSSVEAYVPATPLEIPNSVPPANDDGEEPEEETFEMSFTSHHDNNKTKQQQKQQQQQQKPIQLHSDDDDDDSDAELTPDEIVNDDQVIIASKSSAKQKTNIITQQRTKQQQVKKESRSRKAVLEVDSDSSTDDEHFKQKGQKKDSKSKKSKRGNASSARSLPVLPPKQKTLMNFFVPNSASSSSSASAASSAPPSASRSRSISPITIFSQSQSPPYVPPKKELVSSNDDDFVVPSSLPFPSQQQPATFYVPSSQPKSLAKPLPVPPQQQTEIRTASPIFESAQDMRLQTAPPAMAQEPLPLKPLAVVSPAFRDPFSLFGNSNAVIDVDEEDDDDLDLSFSDDEEAAAEDALKQEQADGRLQMRTSCLKKTQKRRGRFAVHFNSQEDIIPPRPYESDEDDMYADDDLNSDDLQAIHSNEYDFQVDHSQDKVFASQFRQYYHGFQEDQEPHNGFADELDFSMTQIAASQRNMSPIEEIPSSQAFLDAESLVDSSIRLAGDFEPRTPVAQRKRILNDALYSSAPSAAAAAAPIPPAALITPPAKAAPFASLNKPFVSPISPTAADPLLDAGRTPYHRGKRSVMDDDKEEKAEKPKRGRKPSKRSRSPDTEEKEEKQKKKESKRKSSSKKQKAEVVPQEEDVVVVEDKSEAVTMEEKTPSKPHRPKASSASAAPSSKSAQKKQSAALSLIPSAASQAEEADSQQHLHVCAFCGIDTSEDALSISGVALQEGDRRHVLPCPHPLDDMSLEGFVKDALMARMSAESAQKKFTQWKSYFDKEVAKEEEDDEEQEEDVVTLSTLKPSDFPGLLGDLVGPFTDSKWNYKAYVHEQCALYSPKCYSNDDDELQNVKQEISRGRRLNCTLCGRSGASIGCQVGDCPCTYHYLCAFIGGCLLEDESYNLACPSHRPDRDHDDDEDLGHISKKKGNRKKSSK